MHHFFFFRPLGQSMFDNGDMQTLNETAADIAGREIGDMAFRKLGGVIEEDRLPAVQDPPDEPVFRFDVEMRETRKRVDELLAEGRIEEAEAYMEERRLLFVENGSNIREAKPGLLRLPRHIRRESDVCEPDRRAAAHLQRPQHRPGNLHPRGVPGLQLRRLPGQAGPPESRPPLVTVTHACQPPPIPRRDLFTTVIPAKAGIQRGGDDASLLSLDSRGSRVTHRRDAPGT